MDQTGTVTSVRINGPALRAIRERSGMSCSALARAVGADVSFLARVERGEKRGVGRGTYERIVQALGIDGRAILLDPFDGPAMGKPLAKVEPMASHGLRSARDTRTAA